MTFLSDPKLFFSGGEAIKNSIREENTCDTVGGIEQVISFEVQEGSFQLESARTGEPITHIPQTTL